MDLVSNYGMVISGAILLVAYIFIASEKIQKSVVALVGASLTMLLGLLPFHGSVNPQTETYIRSVFDYIELLLENTVLDNKKFKEIIMEDDTIIDSKD